MREGEVHCKIVQISTVEVSSLLDWPPSHQDSSVGNMVRKTR